MSETKNMTPEAYAKFLDSLKVTKEGPCPECNGNKCDHGDGWTPCNYCGGSGVSTGPGLFNGIPLDADLQEISEKPDEGAWFANLREATDFIEYLLERCRRAESNAKPETLLEDVKAAVRAGMDAQNESSNAMTHDGQEYWDDIQFQFRKLSEAKP